MRSSWMTLQAQTQFNISKINPRTHILKDSSWMVRTQPCACVITAQWFTKP